MPRDGASLRDILEHGNKILDSLEGVSLDDFLSNEVLQDAILHRLQIMGEATKRLSWDYRNRYSHVPWRRIAGFRDIIVHVYDDIDMNLVWKIATKSVPALLEQLEALLIPGDDD